MNNKNLKKGLSLILALAMICSIFVTIVIPTQAAVTTQPAQYSKVSNSGQRDVVCTTLSGTSASSYYTGSNVYAVLSQQSASEIQTALGTLMKNTHSYTSSYNDCHYKADCTDCENEDGKVSLIYTSYSATMSQWNGWNREHVWPQSLGGGNTSGGGADLHHIRPSDATVNSTRGNKKYGNVTNGTNEYGSNPATGYLGGSYNSTYFEPLNNVKGDVARIVLYMWVRWGSTWGCDSVTEVFQSVDVLLEWIELDPVDTWEMGRKEVVQAIQGNRNVFIDYPEYAWLIFGKDVPANLVSPSNNKGTAANPGGSGNSGGTQGGGTGGQGTTVTIPESAKLQCVTTYVTTNATSHTNSSGATKAQLAMTSDKSAAATWDIIKNSDGSYSFKSAGKYLSADGTHVKLVNAQDANTKFEFEQTNGGVFIKCQSATYENKAQYLEVYSNNLTVYGMQADTAKYTFTFADSVVDGGGNGNDGKDEPTESETETVIETETETETESLVQDTTASISFGNRDQRTEFSAEKQVWTQNGITFINEKADSAKNVANYANPIRLYEGSTVKAKVEGNKMITKVVIKAAFGDEEYKAAIGDSLRAAGYEYTRDGDDFIVVVNAGSLSFALCAEARITAIDVSYNDTVIEEETETEIETSTETETEINTESETETVVETESETETEQVDVEPTETETDEKSAEPEPETSTSQVGGEDKDDGTDNVEGGCASAIGTGSIVIISISLAGVMLSRKKKEE